MTVSITLTKILETQTQLARGKNWRTFGKKTYTNRQQLLSTYLLYLKVQRRTAHFRHSISDPVIFRQCAASILDSVRDLSRCPAVTIKFHIKDDWTKVCDIRRWLCDEASTLPSLTESQVSDRNS